MTNIPSFKFSVKGTIIDFIRFFKTVPNRTKRIQNASNVALPPPQINLLSKKLHPTIQHLIIQEIRDETPTTKTFKFGPNLAAGTTELAYFRAGQYLSLKINIDGAYLTRPYSIASAPCDALNGFYEITMKKPKQGFATEYIWKNWKVGTKVDASEPLGFMYYEQIRDSPTLVGLAGGSGITPFRSMAREICYGKMKASLTIIYGCSDENDIIYMEEFKKLMSEYPSKVKVVYVMSCEITHMTGCETGFISASIIKKYSENGSNAPVTYFMCGPAIMYDFVSKQLNELHVPTKRIRREAYGEIKNPQKFENFPKNIINSTFKIKVEMQGKSQEIAAKASESILIALERAKLAPPSACRSGECQFCRTKLLKGNVWISPECDGRRMADKMNGYIHPCVTFPIGDLDLILPINNQHTIE